MSKYIHIDVGAKLPTIASCVKFTAPQNIVDSITKDRDYIGESQKTISFTNSCSVPFSIEGFVLFTDNANGGNFEARVSAFSISSNQSINIPVKYYGINKSTTTPKNFNLTFNGSSVNYQLGIIAPVVSTPPVITSIFIELENRTGKVFSLADFTSHYSDADGHNLDAIILTGDVSAFRLSGQPIVSGQEIPANQINTGALQFLAQNTNNEVSVTVSLKAKDESGSISN